MTEFTSSQLRLLRNASEGVKRVTRQLEETIYELANIISDYGTKNDSILIEGKKLAIIEDIHTGYNYLVLELDQKTEQDIEGIIFDYNRNYKKMIDFEGRNITIRFHGYKPTKNYYKWFAENLGNILQGFIDLWKTQESEKKACAVLIKRELRKIIG